MSDGDDKTKNVFQNVAMSQKVIEAIVSKVSPQGGGVNINLVQFDIGNISVGNDQSPIAELKTGNTPEQITTPNEILQIPEKVVENGPSLGAKNSRYNMPDEIVTGVMTILENIDSPSRFDVFFKMLVQIAAYRNDSTQSAAAWLGIKLSTYKTYAQKFGVDANLDIHKDIPKIVSSK